VIGAKDASITVQVLGGGNDVDQLASLRDSIRPAPQDQSESGE
jgi:hypothetical protein